MPTIFDNVATKENDHSQLVRNLMDRSPLAATTLLEFFTGLKFPESEAAHFAYQTQQSSKGPNGREIPDIAVHGVNFQCLVEVKVDPNLGLNPNQLKGYASCFIPKKRLQHLCFLVPHNWKHSNQLELVRKSLDGQDIQVRLCTWPDLVAKLSDAVAKTNDALLKEVLSFWKWSFEIIKMTPDEREFLKNWSGEKFRPFRKLEMTVDKAKKRFKENYETEDCSNSEEYGFYIKRGNTYLLWIGIWDKASAALSYGYQLDQQNWLKPSGNQPGGETLREGKVSFHLWKFPESAWDDAEDVYDQVVSHLKLIDNPSSEA